MKHPAIDTMDLVKYWLTHLYCMCTSGNTQAGEVGAEQKGRRDIVRRAQSGRRPDHLTLVLFRICKVSKALGQLGKCKLRV